MVDMINSTLHHAVPPIVGQGWVPGHGYDRHRRSAHHVPAHPRRTPTSPR